MKIQSGKIVIITALIVSIVMPFSVSAAPSAGIKPSSVFYFLDIAAERVNLFFTFNPEKKARKALGYSEERLVEVEAVANENNPESVATAMANYQENVSLATTESKEIKDKEKAQNLLSTIADNTSKHQEVLAEVYNKVPDEAKKAIEKAIEISNKGHEEALKEIQGLKKTVEELQKDLESLKQRGRSDQSKEIEVLRKEVETLKSQQSSQSAKPQVKEATPITEVRSQPQVEETKSQNPIKEEIIDKAKIVQIINGTKTAIIQFNEALAESNRFTKVKIPSDMAKYPGSALLQQAGHDLLTNNAKHDFLMGKLVEIDTKILNKVAPYAESSSILQGSEIMPLLQEYESYFKEYKTSEEQMTPLMKSFVNALRIAVDDENNRLDNELDALRRSIDQANQDLKQQNQISNKQAQLNAVNQKIAALNAKYVQDMKAVETNAVGITTDILNRQKAEIDRIYRSNYNALQAEYQQIQYSN